MARFPHGGPRQSFRRCAPIAGRFSDMQLLRPGSAFITDPMLLAESFFPVLPRAGILSIYWTVVSFDWIQAISRAAVFQALHGELGSQVFSGILRVAHSRSVDSTQRHAGHCSL